MLIQLYIFTKHYPPGPAPDNFNIFQTPEAVATILLAAVNSQVKKTIDFVFFCIFVLPNNSWPNFTGDINFSSKEIVTHGF